MHCSRLLTLAHACSRFVRFPRFFLGSPRFFLRSPSVFLRSPSVFLRSYIDTAHACSRLLTLSHARSQVIKSGHACGFFFSLNRPGCRVCMPWCYALMNFSCNNNCLNAKLKHWVKGSQPKICFGLPNAKFCLLPQKTSDVLQLSMAPIEWRFHGLAKGSCHAWRR